MEKGKISIVIRTYNEEKWLGTLLEEISKQTYTNFDVILVDSGSCDDTIYIAKKFSFVKIVNIKKEDFSFGYSLNKGVEASNSEFCLFVSGHCYPVDDLWLEEMIKPFSLDKKVSLVYGKQQGRTDITKFSEHMIFENWFPDIPNNNQMDPFCNNANCVIKKSVWENYTKYDENVLGLEDLVFAKVLLDNGLRLVYNPKASVYHIHEENLNSIKTRYEREATTYYSVYPNQKFTKADMYKLIILNIYTDIKHLFKTKEYKFTIREVSNIFKFRINQFTGTYKGYVLCEEMYKMNNLRKRFYYPRK